MGTPMKFNPQYLERNTLVHDNVDVVRFLQKPQIKATGQGHDRKHLILEKFPYIVSARWTHCMFVITVIYTSNKMHFLYCHSNAMGNFYHRLNRFMRHPFYRFNLVLFLDSKLQRNTSAFIISFPSSNLYQMHLNSCRV